VSTEVAPELAAIPELEFGVTGARALSRAAVPTIELELELRRARGSPVRSATVGARVDIACARRAYDADTEARLVDLFGEPERWGSTLRTLGWARTTLLVGPFDDRTRVTLPLQLSYDFDVAANKYLHALRDGEIPLDLSFTGSVLYDVDGRVQAAPIAWDREATYRLPVNVWREAMDAVFPDAAWLRLRRDVFDRLNMYRAQGALPSWEAAVEALLEEARWTG
jgi:hypothetical protein